MSSNDDSDQGRRAGFSNRPTVVPPVAPSELARQPAARPTPATREAVRDPQATITNEDELERARVASIELMATPLPVPATAYAPVTIARADDPEADMRERFSVGDFAGALEAAEKVLAATPAHADADRIAKACRESLAALYESKLGSFDRVPFVVVAREELKFLALDHRAGFLLSHVDGVSTLETILDVSGMPRLDAMRILVELVQKRVVALR